MRITLVWRVALSKLVTDSVITGVGKVATLPTWALIGQFDSYLTTFPLGVSSGIWTLDLLLPFFLTSSGQLTTKSSSEETKKNTNICIHEQDENV